MAQLYTDRGRLVKPDIQIVPGVVTLDDTWPHPPDPRQDPGNRILSSPNRNHGKQQGSLESLVTAFLLGYMVSSKATETGPFWGG